MKYVLFPLPAENAETFPIFSTVPASDEFKDLVCTGGSPALDCQLCGRNLFNLSGEFMDPGELEDLLEKQKQNPEKYCGMDNQVHSGHLLDLQIVINCPCNGLRLFEEFILGHSRFICTFIAEVNKERRARADEIVSLAKKALA